MPMSDEIEEHNKTKSQTTKNFLSFIFSSYAIIISKKSTHKNWCAQYQNHRDPRGLQQDLSRIQKHRH